MRIFHRIEVIELQRPCVSIIEKLNFVVAIEIGTPAGICDIVGIGKSQYWVMVILSGLQSIGINQIHVVQLVIAAIIRCGIRVGRIHRLHIVVHLVRDRPRLIHCPEGDIVFRHNL